MPRFFVSCPIGFESEVILEVKELWPFFLGKDSQLHSVPFPEIEVLKGGIEFECPWEIGVQLPLFVRTAHRVLVRIHQFSAKDFPKFFQSLKSIRWEQFFSEGRPQTFKVEAQRCRLNNEKRIEELLVDFFKKSKREKVIPVDLYVRGDMDQFTLSLDLVGEHLHKRGYSLLKGEAPMRENLASWGLRRLIDGLSPNLLQESILWDPFCGSGTIVTEAQILWGYPLKREMAFQQLKTTPKLFKTQYWDKNYRFITQRIFHRVCGSDISSEVLSLSHRNAENLKNIYDPRTPIEWFPGDFKNIQFKKEEGGRPLLVLMNPPYGERLPEIEESFGALLKCFIERHPQILRVGVFAPSALTPDFVGRAFSLIEKTPFKNGGLPVTLKIWSRQRAP